MRFTVLGSGSSGNSAVVECDGLRLLIDAGLSAKQLSQRLALVGIPPESLHAILLTHEHGDHTRALGVFLKKHPLPIYATSSTAHVVRESGLPPTTWKLFESGQSFPLGHLTTIHTYRVHHDAVDPVGFVIESSQSGKIGILSDVGHVTHSVTQSLRDVHMLFVEANYDEELLAADTKRPWGTKQRISSHHGHLSNGQTAALIGQIAHSGLRHVILGHLSSDCNHPDRAISHIRAHLAPTGHHHIALTCACQHTPTPWFSL
jgi:phosphoribosyl 1,2-cyclic phosphodiesterase